MSEPKIVYSGPDLGPGLIRTTNYEFGGVFAFQVEHRTAGSFYPEGDPHPEVWETRLPHSCDEWVIGDPEELEIFIAEASAVVEWLKGRA